MQRRNASVDRYYKFQEETLDKAKKTAMDMEKKVIDQ